MIVLEVTMRHPRGVAWHLPTGPAAGSSPARGRSVTTRRDYRTRAARDRGVAAGGGSVTGAWQPVGAQGTGTIGWVGGRRTRR